jgi:hypothetical protein
MLIRLLQAFDSISIDLEANPDAKPPVTWASGNGREAIEKVWLKSHIVMYAKVRFFSIWTMVDIDGVSIKDGVWLKMTEAKKDWRVVTLFNEEVLDSCVFVFSQQSLMQVMSRYFPEIYNCICSFSANSSWCKLNTMLSTDRFRFFDGFKLKLWKDLHSFHPSWV